MIHNSDAEPNIITQRSTLLALQDVEQRESTTYDALVLDARLRQSLVTVRSLGQQGL
ncbi:MAG: hypothetical protein JO125_13265, partial [Chloroflexi bacterium]|nr:hypothetical protein [Chloroflexota bacterium]